MTLVELLVVMLIMGIVGTIMMMAIMMTSRTDRQTDQDLRALNDLRLASTHMQRDLRQARRLYMDSTATRVHFWVDEDRDNQQEPSERINYEIVTRDGGPPVAEGSPAMLVRYTDAAPSQRFVVSEQMQLFPATALDRLTFQYSPTFTPAPTPSTEWARTTLVTLTFAADAAPGPYPGTRTLRTNIRMRNARTY